MTNKHNKHSKTKAPAPQRAEIMRRRKILSDALRAKRQAQNADLLSQLMSDEDNDDVPTPSEREALLKSRGIKIDPTTGLSDRFTDIWNDESTFTPIDNGKPEMTDDELEEYLRNIPNKKQKG